MSALLKHMRGKNLDSSSAARHSRDGLSASRVGVFAIDSIRRDKILQPGGQGHWPAKRLPRRCPRLRHQSGRGCDPVPSRGSRGRQHGRLSLGDRAEEGLAGDGAAVAFRRDVACYVFLATIRGAAGRDVASNVSTTSVVKTRSHFRLLNRAGDFAPSANSADLPQS